MEHVRMKVEGIDVVSLEDKSTPFCVDCIATRDANLCQCITDAHEVITGNTTCRNAEDKPIIWNKEN